MEEKLEEELFGGEKTRGELAKIVEDSPHCGILNYLVREIQSVKKALSQDIEEVDDKVDDLEGTYQKGHEQQEEQIAVLKRRLDRQEQNTSKVDSMKMEIVTELSKLFVSKRQF